MKTQVCVVGAGPGGLSAAISLSQKGISTVLVDRAVFPRHKACGDILTSNVLRALHDLNPRWVDELLHSGITHQVESSVFASGLRDGNLEVAYHSPSNERLGLPSCLSTSRYDFDNFLMKRARHAPGVDILEGTTIRQIERTASGLVLQAEDGDLRIEADLVMLATGANSPMRLQLCAEAAQRDFAGKRAGKHTALGLRAYYRGVKGFSDGRRAEYYLFDRKLLPGGLYVTPLGDDLVNVNIVMRQDVVQSKSVNLRGQMEAFIAKHPVLRKRFAGAEPVGRHKGSMLHLGTRSRQISGERYMLIGDAAGLTDATNANGIGHAMLSGQMAAAHAASAIERNDYSAGFLKNYDRAIYRRMNNTLLPGKVMTWMFANRAVTHLTSNLINAALNRVNPAAVQRMVYAKSTNRLMLNPLFYIHLLSGNKG